MVSASSNLCDRFERAEIMMMMSPLKEACQNKQARVLCVVQSATLLELGVTC